MGGEELIPSNGSASQQSAEVIQRVYEGYTRGDTTTMLAAFHPELEWTYLDPSLTEPVPQVCRGRGELGAALERQAHQGLMSELEEIVANGERVMVVMRTPGIGALRTWRADDRTFTVFTVREGRIVSLRDCRGRDEALAAIGRDPRPT